MKPLPTILFSLTLATSALAHGFVSRITIDGNVYKGDIPNGELNPSIIRLIDTTSPVKGTSNPDINCGSGTPKPAQLVGNAMPGDLMTFTWDDGDGGNWPHNTGPLITYMASCGSTTCDQFDSTTAKWFKIDQQGQKSDGSGNWNQGDVMNGAPVNVTLPPTLAPGNYLVRHEIIGLHLATAFGGAEFYPSCSQLTVGGSQTGGPTTSELVSFPGAYSDTDPGIFDPNVFDVSSSYTFPGPNIAAFVGASSASADSPSATATSATSSSTATSNAPTATSQKSAGTCKLKRKTTSSSAAAAAATVRPRHLSRIMRGLIAGHALSS